MNMKKSFFAFILTLTLLITCGCNGGNTAVTTTAAGGNTDAVNSLNISSEYTLVYGQGMSSAAVKSAEYVRDTIKSKYNVELRMTNDSSSQSDKEIVFNAENRSDCKNIMDTLGDGEYVIRVLQTDGKKSIIIAAKGADAISCAATDFVNKIIEEADGKPIVKGNADMTENTNKIVIAEKGKKTDYVIKYEKGQQRIANFLKKQFSEKMGVEIETIEEGTNTEKYPYEILLNSDINYKGIFKYYNAGDNKYIITAKTAVDGTRLLIYFTDNASGYMAVLRFAAEYMKDGTDSVVLDRSVRYNKAADSEDFQMYEDYLRNGDNGEITDQSIVRELVIRRTVGNYTIRDATVLHDDNGKFYLCSSYLGGDGPYWRISESDSLAGPWGKMHNVLKLSDLADKYGMNAFRDQFNWAPELHKYNGAYYIFTTYWCTEEDHDSIYNEVWNNINMVGHRASVVLKSDSPTGPFVPISKDSSGKLAHPTPANWDTIDATFYVDDDGQPWMIFSHEWTSMPDGVGSFCAAKLSEDLSTFISEPIEIFKAGSESCVTDGCWMYKTKDGQLLCLWSTFGPGGYVVRVSRSKSGKIDGQWTTDPGYLYYNAMFKKLPGGHPSTVVDERGQLYMVIHTPNNNTGEKKDHYVPEAPTYIPLIERDGKLIWGLGARDK